MTTPTARPRHPTSGDFREKISGTAQVSTPTCTAWFQFGKKISTPLFRFELFAMNLDRQPEGFGIGSVGKVKSAAKQKITYDSSTFAP